MHCANGESFRQSTTGRVLNHSARSSFQQPLLSNINISQPMSTPNAVDIRPNAMKKPALTASHIRKPTTSQPASFDPQTAALGFLQTNRLAFHDDSKWFFIFVEKRQEWYRITFKQLQRRLKRWVLDTHNHSMSSAALRKMVAELEVAAPYWTTPMKPGVFGFRQWSAGPSDEQQRRVNRVIPPAPVVADITAAMSSTAHAAARSTWRRWMLAMQRLWRSLLPAK